MLQFASVRKHVGCLDQLLPLALRLARGLFHVIFPNNFQNSELNISHFLDIQHLEYATDPFENYNYTAVIGEVSTFR